MPTYTYAECTRENLAPNSNNDVWQRVTNVITHIYGLNNNLIAIKRGDDAVIFRINDNPPNLITLWPLKNKLAFDLRAGGPESQNRISPRKTLSPAEFDQVFETIKNGIYEVFVGR